MRRFISTLICTLVLAISGTAAANAQTVNVSALYALDTAEGDYPGTYMIQASDGNYYGVAQDDSGGSGGFLFQVTPSGVATTLYTFACNESGCPNGGDPNNIIEGGDGNLYGTTLGGGAYGQGEIFKFTPPSTLSVLHSFCMVSGCPEGDYPYYSLIEGSDGNFYGSTQRGGSTADCVAQDDSQYSGCGTLFKITPSGTFTNLYIFCQDSTCPAEGGANGPLLEGSDGNFYGTESTGVFQLTPSGSVALIASLSGALGGVTEGSNQQFYGSALNSNASPGIFFEVSQQNAVTDLLSSTTYNPFGQLLLASDGNFYQGAGQGESLIQLTSVGKLKTLLNYGNSENEDIPFAMIQGSDGNLLGSTYYGGNLVKFTLTPALPAPVQVILSNPTPNAGDAETLTYKVLNAFSNTMQQCYLFSTSNFVQTALGKLTGSLSGNVYGGTVNFNAGTNGVYTYGVTCGGVESGTAVARVGGAKADSILSLAVPGGGASVGGSVEIVASAYPAPNIAPLTGSATFRVGATSLGTLPLTKGTATLTVVANNIPIGLYPVTVTYSGDANYLPSSSTTEVSVMGYITETTLNASTTQLAQGQPITLSASVVRYSVGGTPSGGTVSFIYGSDVLGTAKLVNGVATLVFTCPPSVPPGSYAVAATYNGDAEDYGSASATQTIKVLDATSTSFTVTPNPVPAGTIFTIKAKVAEKYGSAVPTGTVTLSGSGVNFGSATLGQTGMATINESDSTINAGSYSVQAVYSGDENNAASTSPAVTITIQ
jgi:uncharacterized repeat protein (TIGR03803 family)